MPRSKEESAYGRSSSPMAQGEPRGLKAPRRPKARRGPKAPRGQKAPRGPRERTPSEQSAPQRRARGSKGRPFPRSLLSERALRIAEILLAEYPQAKTALKHKSALQLLVATILAAQCTDVRVNIVTKELFNKYKTAADFANAKQAVLEREIHSTGFFRQKAKSIIECCKDIVQKFGGKVPDTMEELTSLRGVGRKTANVILGNYYGRPAYVVDTHVKRLSQRLGLTKSQNPDEIEEDVTKLLPENLWTPFSDALIYHGRAVCVARKPKCKICVVASLCPSAVL